MQKGRNKLWNKLRCVHTVYSVETVEKREYHNGHNYGQGIEKEIIIEEDEEEEAEDEQQEMEK